MRTASLRPTLSFVIAALLAGSGCKPEAGDPATPPDPAPPERLTEPSEAHRRPQPPGSWAFVAPAKPAEEPAPPVQAAPLSLTASDGTGLRLVALEASAVIEEPLAFTELRLTFENPEPRVMEGRFEITLPPSASISRFAMKIGDHWQEGEVLERQLARRVYEDFLHRRQDPALLEQEAANLFSARVFPIPPRAVKELIVSYSQELGREDQPYEIPLVGLPELGRLNIRALVSRATGQAGSASSLGGVATQQQVVEVAKTSWKPDVDFRVAQAHEAGRLGLRHENLVVARVTPVVASDPAPVPSLLVLVDSSASRALGWTKQVRLVESLLRALERGSGAKLPVLVVAFDQGVEPIYEGPVSGFGAGELKRLADWRALGASDLHGALTWVGQRRGGQTYQRVLLVSDGVATAGITEGDGLRDAARALAGASVERLDAVTLGGLRDEATLAQLVTAGLRHDGTVIDGELPLAEVARKLSEATRSKIPVQVAGAKWVWPEILDGVQAGDQVLIYADLPADQRFSLALGGLELAADDRVLAKVERPLLERAWVKARMARLQHQRDTLAAGDQDLRAALAKQITELSVRHRVLSPFTALLVLETEADYARYQIDRRALADILTVGAAGVDVLKRSAAAPALAKGKADGRPVDLLSETAKSAPGLRAAPAAEREPEARREARGRNGDPAAEPDMAAEDVDGIAEGAEAKDEAPREARPAAPMGAVGAGSGGSGSPPPAPPPAPRADAPQRRAMARPSAPPSPAAEPALLEEQAPRRRPPPRPAPKPAQAAPYTGTFAEVMALLSAKKLDAAEAKARAWREESPGDVMALVALGEAFEAKGDVRQAARAYGSLIDLYPSRADLRRFAGNRLDRLAGEAHAKLAADTYAKAVAQRPDHPAGHRLLAFARVKAGQHREAFEALVAALGTRFPDRFPGVEQILREDLGLVAASWMAAAPKEKEQIRARLQAAGVPLEDRPSLRFVLSWETDANDVDFHIHDGRGGHAYYQNRDLPSGGTLYADITTGYGPECFTVRKAAKERAYPYRLQAHYYSRGPMGYGMGKLQVIDHDGAGKLSFDERPFVVMADGAFVELGTVKR